MFYLSICLIFLISQIVKAEESIDQYFMNLALQEAEKGLLEGGVPIGSILVHNNKVLGKGHNLRVQSRSPVKHAELSALDDAGLLPNEIYTNSTLYTTLSPCQMCAGAVSLYQIPRVVIGDNINFKTDEGETYLRKLGKEVVVLNDNQAVNMMENFIKLHPDLWNQDIGLPKTSYLCNLHKGHGEFLQIKSVQPEEKNITEGWGPIEIIIIISLGLSIIGMVVAIFKLRKSKENHNYSLIDLQQI